METRLASTREVRFLPIALTAMTAIGGLLPLTPVLYKLLPPKVEVAA